MQKLSVLNRVWQGRGSGCSRKRRVEDVKFDDRNQKKPYTHAERRFASY